jgi:hypothetical protein
MDHQALKHCIKISSGLAPHLCGSLIPRRRFDALVLGRVHSVSTNKNTTCAVVCLFGGQGGLAAEPLRQAVQVFGHFFQLFADGRALLGLVGALIAELGDAGDLLADVFRHVGLFFRR